MLLCHYRDSCQKTIKAYEDSMKRLSVLLVLLVSLFWAQGAGAKSANYVFTGREIYESCRQAVKGLDRTGDYDDHRFGVCVGYIAGIVDFHTVATTVESLAHDMFCLPAGISTASVIRDVTRFLEDNPGKHDDLASYLVILALRQAYPCQETEEESGE